MAQVANSPVSAWLSGTVFWQTLRVTRCEDLPNMTEQAHCAGNQPANDEPAAAPHTKGINPGDRPRLDLPAQPLEIGGRQGPEPTRYGDWEMRGRCIDF
jgi:hypothetical protein